MSNIRKKINIEINRDKKKSTARRKLLANGFEYLDCEQSSGSFGGNLVCFKYNPEASPSEACNALANYLISDAGKNNFIKILENDSSNSLQNNLLDYLGSDNQYFNGSGLDDSIWNKSSHEKAVELSNRIKVPFIELMFGKNTEFEKEDNEWQSFWK